MMLRKMARVDDDGAESNPFECPGCLEPFSSTDPAICVYISQGKVMFKDLLFVTKNGDDSHIDNGILEVLQIEMHGLVPSSKHSSWMSISLPFSNIPIVCTVFLPHCISMLEIITHQSTCNLNKLQAHICQKLSAHRASKLLTPLLSMVFTS